MTEEVCFPTSAISAVSARNSSFPISALQNRSGIHIPGRKMDRDFQSRFYSLLFHFPDKLPVVFVTRGQVYNRTGCPALFSALDTDVQG